MFKSCMQSCHPIESTCRSKYNCPLQLFATKKNDEKYFTAWRVKKRFFVFRVFFEKKQTDRLKRDATRVASFDSQIGKPVPYLPSLPLTPINFTTRYVRATPSKLSFLLLESSLLAAIRLIDNVVGDTVISSPLLLFFFFFLFFISFSVTRSRRERKQMLFTPCFACRNRGFRGPGLLSPRDTSNPFCNFPGSNETPFSKPFEYLRHETGTTSEEKWRNLEERNFFFFFNNYN